MREWEKPAHPSKLKKKCNYETPYCWCFYNFPAFFNMNIPCLLLEPGVVACWFLYNFPAFFHMNIPLLFFRTRSGCTSRCPPPPAAPSPFRIWRWAVVGPRPPVPAQPPPIRIPATIRTSLPHFTLTGKKKSIVDLVFNCWLWGVAGVCVRPRRYHRMSRKHCCGYGLNPDLVSSLNLDPNKDQSFFWPKMVEIYFW